MSIIDLNGGAVRPDKIEFIQAPKNTPVPEIGDTISIWGNPGNYSLRVVLPGQDTVLVSGLVVKQSPGMTCEHAQTKRVTLKQGAALLKRSKDYEVQTEDSKKTCG